MGKVRSLVDLGICLAIEHRERLCSVSFLEPILADFGRQAGVACSFCLMEGCPTDAVGASRWGHGFQGSRVPRLA